MEDEHKGKMTVEERVATCKQRLRQSRCRQEKESLRKRLDEIEEEINSIMEKHDILRGESSKILHRMVKLEEIISFEEKQIQHILEERKKRAREEPDQECYMCGKTGGVLITAKFSGVAEAVHEECLDE